MMFSKNSLHGFGAIVGLTGSALILAGCGKAPSGQHTSPAPVVTVAAVVEEDVTEWDEFTGRTEAIESVEVRPRVSGHIQEIRFQSGQEVKKGDVLFVIDPRWYRADYDRRQAEYTQAQARLDNAERQNKRGAQLLSSRAIAAEAADTIDTQYQEAKAALLAAKAALEYAKLDLEFTEVRAPIDGRVSRALLTVGNYVNGVAGGASLLTTIVSVDPIYVYTDIDESSLLKFNALAAARKAAGDGAKVPIELELADESGFPHRGYIESFDNRLDAATGTILLRAVFPNTDGRLVPGLFARVRVSAGGKKPALLIEETAIGTDQAQKFVLTLTDKNTVEYRKVVLGPEMEGGRRIVRSGLQKGEKIVVNGTQRARPGMSVSPQDKASTPGGQAQTAQR